MASSRSAADALRDILLPDYSFVVRIVVEEGSLAEDEMSSLVTILRSIAQHDSISFGKFIRAFETKFASLDTRITNLVQENQENIDELQPLRDRYQELQATHQQLQGSHQQLRNTYQQQQQTYQNLQTQYNEAVLAHADQSTQLASQLQQANQSANQLREALASSAATSTSPPAATSSSTSPPAATSSSPNTGATAAPQSANNSIPATAPVTATTITDLVSLLSQKPRTQGDSTVKFSGKEKDSFKRHLEYKVFISKLQNSWLSNSLHYSGEHGEKNKLLNIGDNLEGPAYTLVMKEFDKMHQNPDEPSEWHWQTAKACIKQLDSHFIVASIVVQANNKLKKHKMEGNFKAFPDFLTEFANLAELANMSPEMKVWWLRKKTAKELGKGVERVLDPPEDDDWSGWVGTLTKIWNNRETARQLEPDSFPSGNTHGNQNNSNNARPNPVTAVVPMGDPMDLDRMRLSNKVTELERQYREEHGLCRRCGSSGHRVKDCNDTVARNSPRAPDSADRERAASRANRPYVPPAVRGGFNQRGRGGFQQFPPRQQLRIHRAQTPPPAQPNYEPGYIIEEPEDHAEGSSQGQYWPMQQGTQFRHPAAYSENGQPRQ